MLGVASRGCPVTVPGVTLPRMKAVSVVDLVLLILALLAFAVAATGVVASRVNLVTVGLFLLTLTFLV